MTDHPFAIPGQPPPKALKKRGSLPPTPSQADMRRIKLARQLSTSHPELLVISGGKHSESIDNLKPGKMKPRSNSLHQLAADLKRNLSVSNLVALSDSNLSITKALPPRSYDKPNAVGAEDKQYFDVLVKRYFRQLMVGCGNKDCINRFCQSGKDHLQVLSDTAAVISIQLASNQRHFLCTPCNPTFTSALPAHVFQPRKGQPKQFLQTLYSCSPFTSLFVNRPLIHREKSVVNPKDFNKPISTSSDSISIASASHRKLMSSKLGTGISNKVLYGSEEDRPPKSRAIRSKSGVAPAKVMNKHTMSDRDLQLIKWTSGYDLTGQTIVNVDYQRSTPCLGQRSSKSSYSSVEDLSPSKSENQRSKSKGNHSRSFSSPVHVGNVNSKPGSGLSLTHGPPDYCISSSRLLSPSEALDETDALREFERSLSLELSFDSLEEISLTHLTLPMLKGVVDQYNACKDASFLINTIRTVFTSSQALNASFKKDDSNPDSELCLQAVEEAYQLLLSVKPRDIFTTHMTNALEILLTSLDKSSIEPHQIHQLLILLENPILEMHHELLKIFCHILAHLTSSTYTSLVRAVSQYDVHHFQRLILFFKSQLGSSLKPQQSKPDTLLDVAQVLRIFYDASLQAAANRNITLATREHFYSTELSRGMDYQSEYSKWSRRTKRKDQPGSSLAKDTHSSILQYPFLLDPASKVHVLHLDAVVQMREEYQSAILHQARVNQALKYLTTTAAIKDSIKAAMCPFLVLEIARESLIPDTLAQIRLKQNDLKKPLKIKYVGGGEQGLDMGGLQKEFFQLIAEAVFDPTYGMFSYSEESRKLWINGASLESDGTFELVGTLLGLAIYNGVILNVHFPIAIYKKLHNEALDVSDLADVMPSVGKGLQDMLLYEGDVEDTFCQTFQISYVSLGEIVTVDLIPNGAQTPVTNQNRHKFVRLYKEHILVESVAKQFDAFARGFHMVCGGSALQIFEAAETELLICGSPDLDFNALERSATYEDGYNRRHHTIKEFWEIVHSMSNEQKKKLLHFITGSDRVPLKGLSSLPIVIQRNGSDSNRLPTAMTCFNHLLLPSYATPEKLKNRLMIAIQYGKGFGLT